MEQLRRAYEIAITVMIAVIAIIAEVILLLRC
jgi:hypothetical protein